MTTALVDIRGVPLGDVRALDLRAPERDLWADEADLWDLAMIGPWCATIGLTADQR